MRHIVLDLEMNELAKQYNKERKICRFEIIEIGAVMLDNNFKETDSFKTYVKPQYNDEILEVYENLTGIKTEMVSDAPVFWKSFRMFSDWCGKSGDKYMIYAWGDSDYNQVVKEMKLKAYKPNKNEKAMLNNWCNFQQLYTHKLGVDHAISLKKALTYAGLDFEGKQHDALFDARNTSELVAICNDKVRFEKMLGSVVDAFKEKEISNSLGDMFDFSKMLLPLDEE